MIAGKFVEAIELFRRMLEVNGMQPNEVTLVSVPALGRAEFWQVD